MVYHVGSVCRGRKIIAETFYEITTIKFFQIFPTSLRNTGITICGIVATVVTTTSPFVVDLGKIDQKYPYIVFSMFGIIGAIFTSIGTNHRYFKSLKIVLFQCQKLKEML